ncbi:hypothetical protein DIPPA_32384 [Diplonema papillatum]|nr:hypothetical protein DIPPA_32384 [Diplonema papillatum]
MAGPCGSARDVADLLSGLDLSVVTVADVYRAACRAFDRRVNCGAVHALRECHGSGAGGYASVTQLDFSRSYVGSDGLAPLLPVIECCERLEELDLSRNGLRQRDLLQLIHHATVHPSLRRLYLSINEIGTEGGWAVLRLVKQNRRLARVSLDDCLVIPALLKKIYAATAANELAAKTVPRGLYRYVKVTDSSGADPVPPEVLAKLRREDELREKALAHAKDALPYWVAPALSEVAELLRIHERHIQDLEAMIPSEVIDVERAQVPSRTKPSAFYYKRSASDRVQVTTPADFARALTTVGIRFVSNEALATQRKPARPITTHPTLILEHALAIGDEEGDADGGHHDAPGDSQNLPPEQQTQDSENPPTMDTPGTSELSCGVARTDDRSGKTLEELRSERVAILAGYLGCAVLREADCGAQGAQHVRCSGPLPIANLRGSVRHVLVDYKRLLQLLRTPVVVATEFDSTVGEWDNEESEFPVNSVRFDGDPEAQAFVNYLYDQRHTLRDAVRVVDACSSGTVSYASLRTGLVQLEIGGCFGLLTPAQKVAALARIAATALFGERVAESTDQNSTDEGSETASSSSDPPQSAAGAASETAFDDELVAYDDFFSRLRPGKAAPVCWQSMTLPKLAAFCLQHDGSGHTTD